MIPADFDYVAPDSLEAAIRELGQGGEDAEMVPEMQREAILQTV